MILNVLFLSELFYPHGGGAELATYLYAKLLSEEGINVVVVTNRFGEEPEIFKKQNLVIYRLPLFEKATSTKYSILEKVDVLFSSFMKKLIKEADVVYIPRFWYSAIPLVKLYKKPVVVHLHDYIPICPLSNLYNMLEGKICAGRKKFCPFGCIYAWERKRGRSSLETMYSIALNSTVGAFLGKFLRLCDAVICVSETHRNIIVKADPSLREKTYKIYNPLPNVEYMDVDGDDFGYFGGPNYLKGFHILYQAAKWISINKRRIINIYATNFAQTQNTIWDMLCKNGFILYSRLNGKEYKNLFRKIRCVIVPSIWQETFSYVVVEALFRGRLVIASKIGAIPEVTSGCPGAFLFSVGSFKELVARLLYVKDMDRETIVDLGIKNREIMKRRFNNKKTLQEFMNLLNIVSGNAY